MLGWKSAATQWVMKSYIMPCYAILLYSHVQFPPRRWYLALHWVQLKTRRDFFFSNVQEFSWKWPLEGMRLLTGRKIRHSPQTHPQECLKFNLIFFSEIVVERRWVGLGMWQGEGFDPHLFLNGLNSGNPNFLTEKSNKKLLIYQPCARRKSYPELLSLPHED